MTDRKTTRLQALTQRGEPASYSGAALARIGMPVGGLCCGQVYLGGDGRLWLWDVYNRDGSLLGAMHWEGSHYAAPPEQRSPFRHGFVLRTSTGTETTIRPLDSSGYPDVRFTGRYPIGRVDYGTGGGPVEVTLEAFSPFVPLEADDSSFPATVLAYTVRNDSPEPVRAELAGWLENPVCLESRHERPVRLGARAFHGPGLGGIEFGATEASLPAPRPDVVVEDWSAEGWSAGDSAEGSVGWTVRGTAFGSGPVGLDGVPEELADALSSGSPPSRFVTSHNTANGEDVWAANAHRGTLTSAPFRIERRYLTLPVGGGNWSGQTCVNILVDGQTVASVAGHDRHRMEPHSVDLRRWQDREAVIEIVDDRTGRWGHVHVGQIAQSDRPADTRPFTDLPDAGTFAITALDEAAVVRPSLQTWGGLEDVFTSEPGPDEVDGGQQTVAGAVSVPMDLAPGQSRTVRFVLGWHFPVPNRKSLHLLRDADTLLRHYVTRFDTAESVVRQLADRLPGLEESTRTWVDTWYTDSTLPHWFLERTLATASTLATSACYRFHDGRFYAWEGVYCCPGTCQHVWNYAQAPGRLFPDLERDTRDRVDLGIGFDPDTGQTGFRAEFNMNWAADGQCGAILRTYREHQMSVDDTFLRRVWPRLRQAIRFTIAHDPQHVGILEGRQHNTLDQSWYGQIPWLSGLYVAALHAAAEMAAEMGEAAFSQECRTLAERGTAAITERLWDDECGYFLHRVDPEHPESVNINRGCHSDQLYGQTYASQLGLPRALPAKQSRTALDAIFRHNFTGNPAGYREESPISGGRSLAMAQEPGLLLCTWPNGGAQDAPGQGASFAVGYFNEVWTGLEHQVAAHMLAEGMVEEGLTLTRAVHDRYAATKRNPYNEVECSDHYARAMMSYGAYLAACGYEHHGPKGHIGFAPRLHPENFRAAFTAAGAWGLYEQRRATEQPDGSAERRDSHPGRQGGPPGRQTCALHVRHGQLRVRSLAFEVDRAPGSVTVRAAGRHLTIAGVAHSEGRVVITLAADVLIDAGHALDIEISP